MKAKIFIVTVLYLCALLAVRAEEIYDTHGRLIGYTESRRFWGTAPDGRTPLTVDSRGNLRINDQPPMRRRRNRRPAVSEIELLITQARALRLALLPFTTNDTLSEVAKEATLSLRAASAKLEQLAELTVAAQSRRRRRSNH